VPHDLHIVHDQGRSLYRAQPIVYVLQRDVYVLPLCMHAVLGR
jgi:hypothetical protein